MASTESSSEPASKRIRCGWDSDVDPYKQGGEVVVVPSVPELRGQVKELQRALMGVSSAAGLTPAQKQARAQAINRRLMAKTALADHLSGRGGQPAPALGSSTGVMATSGSTAERRIYIGNLGPDLLDPTLRAAFAPFGTILDVDVGRDPATGKGKGYAFIEFANPTAAEGAMLTMNGYDIDGRPLRVNYPNSAGITTVPTVGQGHLASVTPQQLLALADQANRNLKALGHVAGVGVAAVGAAGVEGAGGVGGDSARVYVGGVPYEMVAEHVKQIFESFGTILSCEMVASVEKPGTHRGYGFIEFASEEAAVGAIAGMDGFSLAGKPLKVAKASSSNNPSRGGAGGSTGGLAPGVAALMAAAGGTAAPAPAVPAAPAAEPSAPPADEAAERDGAGEGCVLVLDNMVGPDDVDAELKLEVAEEAAQHGPVSQVKLHVDGKVRVFVEFEAAAGAAAGLAAMNGRLFDGRTISAAIYPSTAFQAGDFDQ